MIGFSYLLSCVCDISTSTVLLLNGVAIAIDNFRFSMRDVSFNLSNGQSLTIYESDYVWSEYYPNDVLEINME